MGGMSQRSKGGERELSSDAAQAAGAKNLGTLIDTLPLQTQGLLKFKDTGRLIHCFEQGFVDAPADGAPQAMRYDQISRVHQSYLVQYLNHVYRKTSFWFTIGSMTGEAVQWKGSFWDPDVGRVAGIGGRGDPRLPHFGKQLAEQVSKARLPAHQKALADRKLLAFGHIVISQQGVHVQDGVVPWSRAEPLDFHDGQAIVRRTGQRRPVARTRLGSIPNLPLFVTLYENLRRARPT
jgi:hypothetical protein